MKTINTENFEVVINGNKGYFEHNELGEDRGGELIFEAGELVDYDGVMVLPLEVAEALNGNGIDVDIELHCGLKIPQKALKRIRDTEETLRKYGYESLSFYMKNECHRENLFNAGDIVIIPKGGYGVVVGWNGSCNYDVFYFKEEIVRNVHPNNLKGIKE